MENIKTELKPQSRRDSLSPVEDQGRIFNISSYVPFWISSLVVIQLFIVGQTFIPPNGSLNLFQAIVAAVIAGLIIFVMFVVNSVPGMKYGIPFIVQARASFGYFGARIATLIRVLPAVFWYGIGSWIGGSAVSFITETFWGWSNTPLYFVIFLISQTILVYYGIQVVKWVNVLLSVIVLGFLIYINVQLLTIGNIEVADSWRGEGTWGLPFFASITAAVGILITGAINNGDIARYLKPGVKNNLIGHAIGIIPTYLLLVFTGILAAVVTGIWDPIEALVSVFPNPILAVLMLIFIIAAQVTTNLTLNIIPPAIVIMETFNITWGMSTIIVGILGAITFPWVLLTSEVFNTFIAYYSAFLGPLFGILVTDYYFVRKQEFNLNKLYIEKIKYNWVGLSSLLIGGIFGIIFLEISWMVAMPISSFLYWLGYKLIPFYVSELEEERKEDDLSKNIV